MIYSSFVQGRGIIQLGMDTFRERTVTLTRNWITALFVSTLALFPLYTESQEPLPSKQNQTVQFPHAPAYYHNGNSVVRVNVALDELQMESRGNQPIDAASLNSVGTVTSQSEKTARVRLAAPAASLQALNARARNASNATYRSQAVIYGQGQNTRSEEIADILTNRALLKPSEGITIESLSSKYSFTILRSLLTNENIYEIEAGEDSLLAALELANAIYEAGDAEFAQPVLRRSVTLRRVLNDTFFSELWHLNNTRIDAPFIPGNDAKVIEAWDLVTGLGVNVLVVDTGVAVGHPDLSPNVRADLDWDFLDNDGDPTPNNSHGTSVAGIAAAKGDNLIGVAGAAFDASIVGIRLVDASPTDDQIVDALAFRILDPIVANQAHISNNSWGPSDTSAAVKEALTPAMEAALLAGVTSGREGKGVVYVWAAGNGRNFKQDINYDGFASSRFTIAAGASGGDGFFSFYSEPGASMLVTAPSSFIVGALSRGTWSTTGANNYTSSFGGTSSSAPLVSGIVALMLEANANLTWRDVQHILVATSTKIDLAHTDWFLNGAGNLFNHSYGFGRVHAVNAVTTAATWTNVAPWTMLSGSRSTPENIPDNNATGISQIAPVFSVNDFSVEHVELRVNITHTFRGDLVITLQSPSGTRSVLTSLHTDFGDDYDNWLFTSVAHWGENPVGDWTLKVSDEKNLDVGTLNYWSLRIYGTAPQQGAIPTMKVPFFSKP